MLILAALTVLLALLLLWFAGRQQRSAGLPSGQIIYADTRSWLPLEEPLYAADLGLTGRPDYLVEQGHRVIPVELKSTRVSQGPYDTHIYQLAAYCLLVERAYHIRPPYGILHYPNRTYRVDFTQELENATLAILDEMRAGEHRREMPRSHEIPARCHSCGFRSVCDQRIG